MNSLFANFSVVSKAGKMFRLLRIMQTGTLVVSLLIIVWNVFFRDYQKDNQLMR